MGDESSEPSVEPRANGSRADTTKGPWDEVITLGFDGGGIRGYWSLLVLKSLMVKIKEVEQATDRNTLSSFHPEARPDVISQRRDGQFTAFLPCHYFDLIGGTSTGALIAILLSQFRMTVEDCEDEYKKMGTSIFGHPRKLHAANWPFTEKTKFSTRLLTKAFEDVIGRRMVATADTSSPATARFQTDTDTCRGFVLSMTGGVSVKLHTIRSYGPNGVHQPQAPDSWTILAAARAATAAPFYFKRFTTRLTSGQDQRAERIGTARRASTFFLRNQDRSGGREIQLTDAGFGYDNNPCREIQHEASKQYPGARPVIVSIGTARPVPPKNETKRQWMFTLVTGLLKTLGNPEEWHNYLQREEEHGKFSYHRLNFPGGLKMEMDEWIPKKDGHKTIAKMEDAFGRWANTDDAQRKLQQLAEKLVRVRRERAVADGDRWARYALGRYYVCEHNGCNMHQQRYQCADRFEFEDHLRRHYSGNEDIEAIARKAQRKWAYQHASRESA